MSISAAAMRTQRRHAQSPVVDGLQHARDLRHAALKGMDQQKVGLGRENEVRGFGVFMAGTAGTLDNGEDFAFSGREISGDVLNERRTGDDFQ